MKPPLPLVLIALKDAQIDPLSAADASTSDADEQAAGSEYRGACDLSWALVSLPQELSHYAQCCYRHMSHSASQPRPQPGVQTGSGWRCSRTRSQRTDQGSLRAVC